MIAFRLLALRLLVGVALRAVALAVDFKLLDCLNDVVVRLRLVGSDQLVPVFVWDLPL